MGHIFWGSDDNFWDSDDNFWDSDDNGCRAGDSGRLMETDRVQNGGGGNQDEAGVSEGEHQELCKTFSTGSKEIVEDSGRTGSTEGASSSSSAGNLGSPVHSQFDLTKQSSKEPGARADDDGQETKGANT